VPAQRPRHLVTWLGTAGGRGPRLPLLMETERRLLRLADGRDIDVLTAGPDGSLALVVHQGTPVGLVLDSKLGQAAAERGLRVVQAARPGYEDSTPRPGRTVADVVADTAAVLDAVGAETYVSIGFSGGGLHTLACAALAGVTTTSRSSPTGDSP
jgi:pimeloyl-ACP methyl ester carboxylesterase